jgi:hypothetical protein
MPSDDRVTQVVSALAGARSGFHSAVVAAAGEIEAYLATHGAPANDRPQLAAAELGAFGAGRIDPERFAVLVADEGPLDEHVASLLSRSIAVLHEIARAGDAPYHVDVAPGRDLAAAVEAGLAVIGRAFGAARVAELARTGRTAAAAKEDPASPYPFARWNRAEREVAPPLTVSVDGGDLTAGGLAACMDGRLKLVLVVRGAAPPAALARLITPGVFVMQTDSPADIARLVAFAGPGTAALVPDGAALFAHDPAAGPSMAERLAVKRLPETMPKAAIGRASAFVQGEELRLLQVLAGAVEAAGAGASAGTVPPAGAAPADLLAAWLLKQANLTDVGA